MSPVVTCFPLLSTYDFLLWSNLYILLPCASAISKTTQLHNDNLSGPPPPPPPPPGDAEITYVQSMVSSNIPFVIWYVIIVVPAGPTNVPPPATLHDRPLTDTAGSGVTGVGSRSAGSFSQMSGIGGQSAPTTGSDKPAKTPPIVPVVVGQGSVKSHPTNGTNGPLYRTYPYDPVTVFEQPLVQGAAGKNTPSDGIDTVTVV